MNFLKPIFKAGLIAGTLDILAAIIILGKMNYAGTLKFIASGVFGPEAFAGGPEMIIAGLIFHYLIALAFTAFWFYIYPLLPSFKTNWILSGFVIGILVWVIMNLGVLPLTNVSRSGLTLHGALLNMSILIVCIGLPVSYFSNRFFEKKEG